MKQQIISAIDELWDLWENAENELVKDIIISKISELNDELTLTDKEEEAIVDELWNMDDGLADKAADIFGWQYK